MASEHLLILKDDGGESHAEAYIGLELLPSPEKLQQENVDVKALQHAQDKFHQAYQHKPQFVARAPGRVNIIGEHIDYNGFGVLPMALQQSVFVACSKTPQQQQQQQQQPRKLELHIQSTNSGAKSCHIYYTVDELWSRIKSSSESENPPFDYMEDRDKNWSHYVLCAIFGVLEGLLLVSSDTDKCKTELTKQLSQQSISLLIHGTVPQGAGVSSSSALVVASAMAFWTLFVDAKQQPEQRQHELSRKQMAALCAKCERWVGTEGGGMDQAISIFAQSGQGRYIQFQPTFQHKAIPLLEGACWVVCHSLEESHKRLDAATQFNKRVVECKVACRWLAQILAGLDEENDNQNNDKTFPTSLWALVHKSGKSFQELETIARGSVPETISRAELISFVIGDTADNDATTIRQLASQLGLVRPAGVQVLTLAESYCVRDRLLHVLTETRRVEEFVALCCDDSEDEAQGSTAAAAKLEALGQLLKASHRSCSEWYDCSSSRVDKLQQVCLQAPGTAGSRMTGAGWGGCVISLVENQRVDAFCSHVRECYYATLPEMETEHLKESDYMFVTRPSQGSTVFVCD